MSSRAGRVEEPRPLGVAILGCGRVVRLFHLPILARMRGVTVRLAADPDPGCRAAVRALAPDAALTSDWRAGIEDPSVEAVVVTLPSGLHAEAASAAFAAGRHVYLEKPIATSHEDGVRVVAAWRASAAAGMTGFQGRFDPTVRALRRAIAGGELGTIVGARIAIGGPSRELPEWKRSRATGGGVLLDLGSHAVDLARFLFDREVASLTSRVSSMRTEDDTAAMALTMMGGTVVQAFVSLAGVQESLIEVVGDQGSLVADRHARAIERRPPRPAYGRGEHLGRQLGWLVAGARRFVTRPDDAIPYRGALAAFARAARSGGPSPSPDIEDGWRSLAAVLAAEAAAREGMPVEPEPAPA